MCKHELKEFICDRGKFSASRFVFLLVNLVYLPILISLTISHGLDLSLVVQLVLGLNAAPAIVYGLNSATRARREESDV